MKLSQKNKLRQMVVVHQTVIIRSSIIDIVNKCTLQIHVYVSALDKWSNR